MKQKSKLPYNVIAFLGALSLFLATVEYLFPKPVPFFRIGLSNLPILLSLDILSVQSVFLLAALKVAGQGLVNGTLASYVFLFSLVGTFTSTSVMMLLRKKMGTHISLIGISLAGALSSNLMQIFLSVEFIFGETAWVIAPILLILGLAGGFVVGFFAQRFSQKSKWYQELKADNDSKLS